MTDQPSTHSYDPEDRLHEAIAAIEEEIDDGLEPDPQEWLGRYPDVAERLAEFFAGRKGLQKLATPLLPTSEPAPCPPPCFADYEGLTEIGRGGMGVVYRGRQISLERDVALKVIRRDRLEEGSPAERRQWIDRFRMEAQLVATLDHPHIVPVYEVGEQDGHHYFSMKLIDGNSLKDCLGRYSGDPRAAAGLMVQVAQAVHHAHQRGLLHRDLKPGNILIDAQGQPHVTDFGLAKRLQTGGGMTQSGALVGTAEYMAPEQAAGRKDLTTTVDVWAFGVILYELLTGRVPFRGDSLVDTLRQVMENEPVPPRRLQPTVPRDLETICLKCLEKDPRKRYASAEELAGRLRLFLENKPIPDRPVSNTERVWRWCRRNRAVASLLGSVAVALLLGTMVSTYFAFDATEQARLADKRAADLDEGNQALKKAVDELMGLTARGLVSRLGHKERVIKPKLLPLGWDRVPLFEPSTGQAADPEPVLTEPEADALWELAGTREDALRVRFLQEALRGHVTTRQLKNRADLALHAAVGLDPRRREEAERMLLLSLQDSVLPEEQRTHVALILAALGDLSPATAAQVSTTLEASLSGADDAVAQAALARALALVVSRLEPNDAATAAAALVAALAKVDDPSVQAPLLQGMKAVAARLQPMQAASVAASLTAALARPAKGAGWPAMASKGPLWQALGAVAARLDPKEGAQLAAEASVRIIRATAPAPGKARTFTEEADVLGELTFGLAVVAPHLDPNAAAASGAALINGLSAPSHPVELSEVLADVTRRMEPRTADRLFSAAGAEFLRRLPLVEEPKRCQLVIALAVLAPRLQPKAARDAGSVLATALPQLQLRVIGDSEAKILSQGLAAIAARLEPEDARRFGAALTDSVRKRGWVDYGTEVGDALEALAARLESKDADQLYAAVGSALVAHLTRQKGEPVPGHAGVYMQGIAKLLAALAQRCAAKQAAELAFALVHALRYQGHQCWGAPEALSALAARLDPKEAARLASTLTAAITPTRDRVLFARCLTAVAEHLDRQEAVRLCSRAFTACADAFAKETDPFSRETWARALAAVAARLEPKEAARVCAAVGAGLAADLAKPEPAVAWPTNHFAAQLVAAEALAAVAARQDPKVAAGLCGKASIRLVAGLSKTAEPANRCALAGGLAEVARWLEPKEAARLSALLTQALTNTPDARVQFPTTTTLHLGLARALVAAAARMKPEDGTAALIAALRRTETPEAQDRLVQGLRRLLITTDATELARKAAATSSLVGCICGSTEQPLQALAFIGKATEPLPSRLSAQQLVNLLSIRPANPKAVAGVGWGAA
jgi:serine/threonine protein kinase